MQSTWKREQRRTIWIALALLFFWALAIYWQGNVTWSGLNKSIAALVKLDFGAISTPYNSLLLDGTIIIGGTLFWMLFFAHFVLPIKKPQDIPEVFKAMLRTLIALKPSALFVRNGEIYPKEKIHPARKARIWLLDSASAAVLRNDTAFTRAIGPGLSFAREEERLAGFLDLRIQRRLSGPNSGEDPFLPKGSSENAASFQARQDRRNESSGLTRDGVEVIPRLEVAFRIEGRQNSAAIPYPFQAEFAWRAIANESVAPQSPSDIRNRHVSWDWLPIQLAADLWREYLRKLKLQELFEDIHNPSKSNGNPTSISGLEHIRNQINNRLQKALVEEKKGTRSSPEYQLLRNRGIRVLEVFIREIHLDAGRDEMRMVNEWSENWEMNALQQEFERSKKMEDQKRSGQRRAAAEFISMLSSDLQDRLDATNSNDFSPPSVKESLSLLVNSTLRNAEKLLEIDSSVLARIRLMKSWLKHGESGES